MTASLWLSRFLLVTFVAYIVLGFDASNDNSFFGERVSNEEALKFFAELDKSPVQNAERRNTERRTFRKFDEAVERHTGQKLEAITDNVLAGNQFDYDEANSQGNTIAAKVNSHDFILLPAMGLKLVGSSAEPIITMEFPEEAGKEKNFKNIKISLKGNLVFTKIPKYQMAIVDVNDAVPNLETKKNIVLPSEK